MADHKNTPLTAQHIELTEQYGAHNYAPLPVVLAEGEGVWVTDVDGKRYMDMLSAYSALNFGHRNPRIVRAAEQQLRKLPLTSRAFYNDQFGPFCEELAKFCGMQMVLAMNSGAEAVESALKVARRWGYEKKGVEEDKAEIICMSDNFAGRTISIISFNTEGENRRNFGPFTPGFVIARFGDVADIERCITKNTVAVMFEPIQGEAGVLMPPDGFLRDLREVCSRHRVLMIADEIQTGMCRTGKRFACDHEGVASDMLILGKSLGGGILPISAVVSSVEILGVLTPGSHGSTFGGNPLACAVAREVLRFIADERPEERAAELGALLMERLRAIKSPIVESVRGRGLMVGVDIKPEHGIAKDFCKKLLHEGLLCKDTRKQTIRFAPPLTITQTELEWALERIKGVLQG
jgi:ornithine--oxo-acid transaminase